MAQEISLVVRIMPNADDVEVSLPHDTKVKALKEHLLQSKLGIPQRDDAENPIVYQLLVKGKNEVLNEESSLQSSLVLDGDLILMIPKVIAGKS